LKLPHWYIAWSVTWRLRRQSTPEGPGLDWCLP
jgi:hypothetical protein